MLGAFNEATPDWLSFFMFTYHRLRRQDAALPLAQSGFDRLSRTCRSARPKRRTTCLSATGINVQRTCEAMKAAGISDPTDIAKVVVARRSTCRPSRRS
jgi:benzoyl-CoA 2,3-dioxygenase component B